MTATAAPSAVKRQRPNILVTGTPGTGKTTLSELVALALGYEHINVSELVKAHSLHDGYDEAFDTFILNDDKLCDELEEQLGAATGGYVVDFHTCDVFPERWFDLVVVLRTDNTVLYDRLTERGYSDKKRSENVECEIMQVVLEEARESYQEEIVVELQSDTVEQMESNTERIQEWAKAWLANNA
ncbi:adenylate kinase isoenzyme 6-like protein [Syncephalis pseudoplumigaleata]|uniref:Adenylate kinase isoenzyme 6 homolog n=1 Tax=Syncephalis pseudoplumigaleata TaxID=1712513 RepID=A0A4P9YY73_9FUNG|nr:adenylate kinase isoenzyme 6-like protein [Syncephalis pseudoplumigaleata]|eukprot:RKP24865.1 adenylate kinase isoenzyme 6-like protein [Syncephalis pseudoplumigaleata]